MSFARLIICTLRHVMLALGVLALLCVSGHAQTVSPLNAYNVNPNTVTVAGISSGGFMAVQLQIAYSKRIFGTAVFAGGPYDCAEDSSNLAQGQCESGNGIPLQTLLDYTNTQAANGTIDPTSEVASKPIYMFSGTNDTTVHQAVMDALKQYYLNYTSASNVTYNNNTAAAHAWISPAGPNSCSSSFIPYINDCGLDPEQSFLTLFYGTLEPKSTGPLGGSYIQFDQNAFVASGHAKDISMDSTGWVYVPANCKAGQACRLVVALHGCLQYPGIIQQQFVQKSGINEWADTNNIIVLYPQATSSFSNPSNPLGCWDWWGYSSPNYALKSAPQMTAIMAMVSQITSGQQGGSVPGVPAAPSGMSVTATTAGSVSLSWNASSGASSYNVYRNGSKEGSSNSTAYTDNGLSASTTYTYTVTATSSSGESAPSSTVSATTLSTPFTQSLTATVVQHLTASRITLAQYLQLGQEFGFNTPITLYLCGSTWTDSPTCGPMQ
jgi:poly(3-hydroxybutyrate) depolymerase